MDRRGQTAFEALFLFVIVTTAAVITLSLYTSISDDTTAMAIARSETNSQLAMQKDNTEINQISLIKTAQDVNVIITLSASADINTTPIQQSIAKRTAFKNITITIQ